MKKVVLALCGLSVLFLPIQSQAHESDPVSIQTLDGSISFQVSVEDPMGGITLAVADLGQDGISEIIVGNGLGSEPRVRVLRQDGSEVGSFLAYAPTLGVGMNVAACDLTGDGYNEIVTAPQRGGGPHIRIFDRYGSAIDGGGFFAYDETFRNGVNLACGDLFGDGRAELVTLPAAGGGPHVRVWSYENGNTSLEQNFFAFHASDRSGVVGVVHDQQLFVAEQFTSTPTLKTMVIHSAPTTQSEQLFSLNARGLSGLFVYNDSVFLTSASEGTIMNTDSDETIHVDTVTDSVAATSDGKQIFLSSGRSLFDSQTDTKRIVVDTSEQRLYAFENGILQNTFLISSGLNNATPLGNHVILAKVPLVHYAWFYGSGSPLNYDLGWVPYNLRFYPHIYVHYAPWHNNFGHPMSHGCVNVGLEDMQWLYGWAEEGIGITIQE